MARYLFFDITFCMKKTLLIILLLTLSYGQSKIITMNNDVVIISQDEVVVEVLGMVCSLCAYGLEKGLSDLDEINKKKYDNGIYIDINNQYIKISVLKNKSVDIDQVASVIRDSGFEANTIFELEDNKVVEYKLDKSNKMKPMNHDHNHDKDHNH